MTSAPKPVTSTAGAVKPPEVIAAIQAAKERTALIAAIRGTQWGASCSPEAVRAVAHYCNINGLDAVRHVEVLGSRIYLTAEFYRERGADLLLDGTIVPQEPQNIAHDDRLDVLATRDDEMGKWAREESDRRVRARIQYGVDEDAPGAAVVRFVLRSGAIIVGCNWIQGPGGKKRDPVGQAEPTKTAITRAERRAWRQVIDAVPAFRERVAGIEASAKTVSAELSVLRSEEKAAAPSPHPAKLLQHGDDAYVTDAPAYHDRLAALADGDRAQHDSDTGRTKADEAFEMDLDR